jgi:hypothetical protein
MSRKARKMKSKWLRCQPKIKNARGKEKYK